MTTKSNVCKVSGLVNSDHLKTILKHKGSTLDIHALIPSHQNGRIERKRRHNVEIARTLLAQSKWPLKFRWEACETTVYLINRLPTPVEAPTESLQKASSNRT